MPRRGVPDEEIHLAIEQIADRGEEPQTRQIRIELGNRGDYSRIQAVLDKWRAERGEQRPIVVPDIPDAVSRALQVIWSTAYKAADDLLETKRTALETERSQFEGRHAEMMQEIAQLEAQRNTAEALAEDRERESHALREELEHVRRDLAADRATLAELRRSFTQLGEEKQRVEGMLREQNALWLEQRSSLETAKAALETKAEQLGQDLEVVKHQADEQGSTITELRANLETERDVRVAAESQCSVMTQQFEALRGDYHQAAEGIRQWMERATTAEAELKARSKAAAPKRATTPRKRT